MLGENSRREEKEWKIGEEEERLKRIS